MLYLEVVIDKKLFATNLQDAQSGAFSTEDRR